jgi:hypothetical protein
MKSQIARHRIGNQDVGPVGIESSSPSAFRHDSLTAWVPTKRSAPGQCLFPSCFQASRLRVDRPSFKSSGPVGTSVTITGTNSGSSGTGMFNGNLSEFLELYDHRGLVKVSPQRRHAWRRDRGIRGGDVLPHEIHDGGHNGEHGDVLRTRCL